MAKGKVVSLKECLEIMRRFEAIEVTIKRLEDPANAHVDATFSQDPTRKSQRKSFKNDQLKPKPQSDSRKADGGKTCVWCKGTTHSRDKCPAKDATCNFCGKQGHFERACLQKKGQIKDKQPKHQHAVDFIPDVDSSDYDDDFDLGVITINAVDKHKSCEVFAPVLFHPKGEKSQSFKITGKVDTGAMVSCIPISMFPQIGLAKSDLQSSDPRDVWSRSQKLWNSKYQRQLQWHHR